MAIAMVTVFLSSCEKDSVHTEVAESVDEASFANFEKNIEIASEDGLNEVNLTILSLDKSLLNDVKASDFKVVPLFEKPLNASNQFIDTGNNNPEISEDNENLENRMPVGFTVDKVELEQGAIGYTIEVKRENYSRAWIYDYWYSTGNNSKVKTHTGCNSIRFYRKKYCSNSFSYRKYAYKCNGGSHTYYGGSSCELKVKVGLNNNYNNYYTVSFWN